MALASLALLVSGCSDTCTCPEDVDAFAYPDQSTPDNVLEKLEMAYENMDADAYVECLAEEFIFFLNPDDVGANPSLPPYWDKAEERMIVWHMFADTTAIGSIDLTLTIVSRDSVAGQDLWEYEVDVDLTVEAGATYISSGMSLFVMRRSPDHFETTWQIVEHHDLGEDEIQRESTTWTTIKLVFGGPGTDSIYPLRTSPENVLRKLNLAYVRMDDEAYLDCLSEDFVFFLCPDDVNDNPELPASWEKAEEATIHGNMFGEGSAVEGIALVFTLESTSHDEGDPSDPLDDTWVLLEDADLRMQLPPDLTLHAQAREEFALAVDPAEAGLGGELLWEITEWHELSPEERAGGPKEDASWGILKALFRELW
jgi:hypothetical protein